jgi:hypothetical protein
MRRSLLMLVVVGAGCHNQADAFYGKIFTCDPNAAQPSCGTTRDGKPMTCFAGTQLGGEDFCVEACDPGQPSDDPRFVCLAAGALVQSCRPSAGSNDSGHCPAGLQCYRTDLLNDKGVCLDMRVCTTDADCAGDPRRNRCAATVVQALFPRLPPVGNLQCLQAMCMSDGASCVAGESCLPNYYDVGPTADICVPKCDASRHCPPNFACAMATAGSGSAPICIPGVPGSRCEDAHDCVFGECFDTGAGFSECVLPASCASDLDCAALDVPANSFLCIEGPSGDSRRCVGTTAFDGAACSQSSDCPSDQSCVRYSPYTFAQGKGECRYPCGANGTCAPRAGVPHTCLDVGATVGGCYPGYFAMPCLRSSDCFAELSCLDAAPDPRTVVQSASICTIPCANDDDCLSNPLIGITGFCGQAVCRLGGALGAPCDRPSECREGACVRDAAGSGTCT